MVKNDGKIILFDIDDTLIRSNANIYVVKNGKIKRVISSTQFNSDRLARGENYDYQEFNSAELLNSAKTTQYFDTLIREYKKGNIIGIVTAREDKKLIFNYLKKNGVILDKRLIFTVTAINSKLSGSIHERKAQVIDILSKKGFNTFVYFDDNKQNIEACEEMAKKLNLKIYSKQPCVEMT